jgi:hypothetical protein
LHLALAAPAAPAAGTTAPLPPSVARLLEDNADTLLPQLTNPTGDPGEGHVEHGEVFSGRTAVRIVPLQRFEPRLPGWNYRIAERPGPGEYRYARWAWKADGCAGTMVQFHIETGWSVRYVAGNNDPGWGAKSVSPDPPTRWVVVTRDLFADFGACAVTGIALAAFRGRGAYFDHVYFGRTVDDLDRVDATGVRDGPPPRLDEADLDRLWNDLGGEDAAKAYRSYWTLAAVPEQSVPFFARSLVPPGSAELRGRIRRWVTELDDAEYAVREHATTGLVGHLPAAERVLREALDDAGPETRSRIEQLLRAAAPGSGAARRRERAVRILRHVNTAAAVALLEELARTDPGDGVTRAAPEAAARPVPSERAR